MKFKKIFKHSVGATLFYKTLSPLIATSLFLIRDARRAIKDTLRFTLSNTD